MNEQKIQRIDVMFTFDLLNGIVAIVVSFFSPVAAFILLFFKIPLFIAGSFYVVTQRRKMGSMTPQKTEETDTKSNDWK